MLLNWSIPGSVDVDSTTLAAVVEAIPSALIDDRTPAWSGVSFATTPDVSWIGYCRPNPPLVLLWKPIDCVSVVYFFDNTSAVSVIFVGRFSSSLIPSNTASAAYRGTFTASFGLIGVQASYLGQFTSSINTSSPLRTGVVFEGVFYSLVSVFASYGSPTFLGVFTCTIIGDANGAPENCITGSGDAPAPVAGHNMMW